MLYITYTLLFSPLQGWSLSLPTSFAWKPPMTSGTVNTARRARPSQRCRTVRTCDKHSQRVAATHSLLTFPFFSCTGTLVVWRANCCANMPPHQRSFGFFNSEYFTSTLRVVCSQAVPAPDCLTYISLSTAVLVCLCHFIYLFIFCFLSSPAPDKAPTILSVTPHTTTSVLVRWQVRCDSHVVVTVRMNDEGGSYWSEVVLCCTLRWDAAGEAIRFSFTGQILRFGAILPQWCIQKTYLGVYFCTN